MTIKNDRRLTFDYTLLQTIFGFRFCVFIAFTPYFLAQCKYSTTQIGIIMGIALIISIILQPLVASFADKSIKFRIKHILAYFTFVSIVLCFVLFIINTHSLFYSVLYIVVLVSMYLEAPLLSSLSTEHIVNGRNLNFSLSRGIGSFAFAIASIIFGWFTRYFGHIIYLPTFIAFSLLYLFFILKFEVPTKNIIEGKKSIGMLKFIANNKLLLIISLSIFFVMISMTTINTYLYKIVDSVGGDAYSLGVCYGLAAFVELFSMLIYFKVKIVLKGNDGVLKMVALAFLVKSIITILSKNIYMLYLAQSLQFFSYGFFLPSYIYYITNTIKKEDQVKAQICINIAYSLAGVFSTLVGAKIISSFGLQTALIVATVSCAIGVIIMFVSIKPEPQSLT